MSQPARQGDQQRGERGTEKKRFESSGIPTSEQMASTIENVNRGMKTSARQQGISSETRDVVHDTEAVLKDTREFVTERNRGEKLQRIIYHGTKLTEDPRFKRPEYSDPQARKEAITGVNAARTFATELLVSTEFRNLSMDLLNVAREFFLSDLPERERSSSDKQHQTSPGHSYEEEEVSQRSPGSESRTTEGRRFSLPAVRFRGPPHTQEEKQKHETQEEKRKHETQEEKQKHETQEEKQKHETQEEKQKHETQEGTKGTEGTEASKKESKSKSLRLSDEQIDTIVDRTVRILRRTSRNPNFRVAMDSLMNVLSHVNEWSKTYGKEQKKTVQSNAHSQQVLRDARDIVEEFSGPGTTKVLIAKVRELAERVSNDKEVTDFLQELKTWIMNSLDDPERMSNRNQINKLKEFIHRAQDLVNEYQYNDLTREVFTQSRTVINNIKEDPLSQKFVNDIRRLAEDITTTRSGQKGIDPQMLSELRKVLMPVIIRELDYIPVPRVEQHGNKYDYWVDDIYIAARDVMPDNIKMKADKTMKPMPSELEKEQQRTEQPSSSDVSFKARNITAQMDDVQFWFCRKKFPKREDSGRADVKVGERGILLKMKLRVNNPANPPVLQIRKCKCQLDALKIKVRDTKSNWLYNLFLKLFSGQLRSRAERKIEERIGRVIEIINENVEKQSATKKSGSQQQEQHKSEEKRSQQPPEHGKTKTHVTS